MRRGRGGVVVLRTPFSVDHEILNPTLLKQSVVVIKG